MKHKRLLSLVLACALCLTFLPAAGAIATQRPYALVAGGTSHSIALKKDGTVCTWGSNQNGQLGLSGGASSASEPSIVQGLSSIISVAAGYDFSAVITADNKVMAWGGGTVTDPTYVTGLENVVAVACGQTELIALHKDGTVSTWTLGNAVKKVSGLSHIAGISAGSQHFLAYTTGGDVYAWGGNWSGQLGTGDTTNRNNPVKLNGIFNVIHIAAGNTHSLAVDSSGRVYAWGSNGSGQLGAEGETRLKPAFIDGLTDITMVAAGNETSLALTTKGAVYTWGYGEFGQLGNNTDPIMRAEPKMLGTGSLGTVSYLTAGFNHNLVLTNNGRVFTWGRNKDQQLGTGNSANEKAPVRVLTGLDSTTSYQTVVLTGASSWAVDELETLYQRKIVPPLMWQDYTDTTTRAEFAHMLVTVYELVKKAATPSPAATFSDLENHPLAVDVLKAHSLGILGGIGADLAAPDATITRQEVTKMLCSFIVAVKGGSLPTKIVDLKYYSDARSIADWANPYVAYAYENNIMQGTEAGFAPTRTVTREQALVIMSRLAATYSWSSTV